MRRWAAAAGMATMLVAGAAIAASAPGPRARIDSGMLAGSREAGVAVFRGVPYAAAPVGARRWAPPAPAARWAGVRPATAFGPDCPQPMNADGSPNGGGASGPTSEDCLFLNVWAPVGARRAPVMVWLHGGGNTTGAGSLGAYDGSAFARDGVVLVTINYRLGPLGFFAHPALTAAAKPGAPLGAYGVMDQVAALKWVRRNIAAFGGDPARVTVAGESAGGEDVLALMASPLARGLFARAIVESGGGWAPPLSMQAAEAQGAALAVRAGAKPGATLAELRALPTARLVAATGMGFGVPVDGALLPRSPTQAFAAGSEAAVPLLIGSNSFEASLMATFHIPAKAILARMDPRVLAAYADLPSDAAKADAAFTDAVMGAPAHWIASHAARRAPAWLYYFPYVPTDLRKLVPGAAHATEIPLVFDSWATLGAVAKGLKPSPEDLAMTRIVHGCWVAFVRTGAPTCPSPAPAWPRFAAAGDALMDFTDPPKIESGFRRRQYEAQAAAQLPRLDLGR